MAVVGSSEVREGDLSLSYLVDMLTAYPDADVCAIQAAIRRKAMDRKNNSVMDEHAMSHRDKEVAAVHDHWTRLFPLSGQQHPEKVRCTPANEEDVVKHVLMCLGRLQRPAACWNGLSKRGNHIQNKEDLAVELLAPLLDLVVRCSGDGEGGMSTVTPEAASIRRLYRRLVPEALRVILSDKVPLNDVMDGSGSTFLLSVWHAYTSNTCVSTLMRPFIACSVNPLEKELCYHFAVGRRTAKVSEPQHYFTFLQEALSRLSHDVRDRWSVEEGPNSPGSFSLLHFAEMALCNTAATIFSNTYGWYGDSPYISKPDFTVFTINGFIDFLVHADGRVGARALILLSQRILFPQVMHIFYEQSTQVVEKALRSGGDTLWRRRFIVGELLYPPLYCSAIQFVRCVEALLRRLTSVASFLSSLLVEGAWSLLVAPSLVFARKTVLAEYAQLQVVAERHEAIRWEGTLKLYELAVCTHYITTAAEDWLDVLIATLRTAQKSTCRTEGTQWQPQSTMPSGPLDNLILCRDELVRHTVSETRHLVRMLCLPSNDGAPAFADAEVFLKRLQLLPDCPLTSTLLSEMKTELCGLLTPTERADVVAHVASLRLLRTAALFAS